MGFILTDGTMLWMQLKGSGGMEVSVKCRGSSLARSNRCEQRPRPGVICDAHVPSVDHVLGQSVFRSTQAVLGQVLLCEGGALCSCQSHLLNFMLLRHSSTPFSSPFSTPVPDSPALMRMLGLRILPAWFSAVQK